MLIDAVFSGAAVASATTFALYPLSVVARRSAPLQPRPGLHQIRTFSIVVAARNEAATIATKVKALLALSDVRLRELIVVNDGSTDATSEAIQSIDDSRIIEIRQPESLGKAAALATALQHVTGDAVVFSDVRQTLAENAIAELLAAFDDPNVAVAGGTLRMSGNKGPGLYWRYESEIRRHESRTGSVPGASGAFYAVRRNLIVAPPQQLLLDDVWIPMHAIKSGGRIVVVEAAGAYDVEADPNAESARKTRTIAGMFQLLDRARWLLFPDANPIFARFALHKVARLFVPYILATLVAATVFGAFTEDLRGTFYRCALSVEALGIGISTLALLGAPLGRVGRLAATFALLQITTVIGLVRFLRCDFAWTTARPHSEQTQH